MEGGLRLDASGVITVCPQCRRANRLAFGTLDRATRCGSCKTTLEPPDAPIDVGDSATFDAAVNGALPALVDFWAPWCGPCRSVAPELVRVAREAAGRFLVLKVNTDVLTEVAARFRISSIPTLGVLHRGAELDRLAGARPAADILAFAERTMAAHTRRAS